MARGQTDDGRLYYWFDSEHQMLYSDSTGSGQWQQMIDVSQLKVGLHTFYVMTTDSKGRMSSPVMRQFYKIEQSNNGEQYRCLCYVDGEMFCQKEVSAHGGLIDMELDATGLSEGMHRIQLQVLTASGVVSGIHNGFFLRTATKQEAGRLRCISYVDGMPFSEENISAEGGALSMNLDVNGLTEGLHSIQMQIITETGVVSGVYNGFFIRKSKEQEIGQFSCLCYVDGELFSQEKMSAEGGLLALDLDTNSLTEGLHRIQLQVMTKSGIISGAYNGFFLRTATAKELGKFQCVCYVDGEMYSQEKLSAEGGLLHLDLDASSLSEGMHRIQLQVMAENGTVSGTYNGFFLRMPTQEEQSNYSCIYVLDNETESHKCDLTGNDGVYHFDLDMSGLSDGLHHISYFLSSDKGATSSPVTRFFIKSPIGGTAIARYQYWLNDDAEHMKTVTLPEAQNPFKLISLLPIEKVPLRSRLFHFEVKDGKPMMYAKNDFHVRFHDAAGRFTDESAQYVDYSVKQEVGDIDEIQEIQAIPSVDENQVKWYCFDALRGDSITLRASKTCTIQIFTEKGEELFGSNGSASVAFSGTHMPEMGTYYVAVHDVTAKNSNNLVLDYRKYDRYCVLEKKPDVIGNLELSYFVLSLKGNGFDKLRSASIVKDENVLMADSVQNFGYADAKLYFTLPAEKMDTGYYDLKLDYKDEGEEETLLVENAIQLVEAEAKNIELSFSEPSTNRSPFSISVHLKNKGNVGYTYLPINIAFDHIDDISDIQFTDFGVCVPEGADSLGYQFMAVTDNLAGKGVRGGMMFFFVPRIEAGEEYVMTFKVTASVSQFNVYAWMGKPIELDDAVKRMNVRGQRVNQAHQTACHILSFGEQVEEITGEFDNRRVNLLGQVTNTTVKAGVALAAVHNGLGNYVHEAQIKAYNLSDDDAEILRSMHPRVATPGEIIGGDFGQWVDRLMGVQRESADCDPNESDDPNNPDDPSNPNNSNDRNRHLVQTRVPVDPNDIIGYMAESSSKAIMNQLNDVYYTIQFENDPKLATASAHEIILADTLDATKFDLSTFAPSKVKIGEKSADLTGDKNFVTTIDMRPEINAIAQVEGTYDESKGIAKWHITSLDPMTMEPTDDVMQGVLPVNTNGNGIGEVSYDISLKSGLAHGTEVNNRASIVFDTNEPIMTPTWTNIIDRIAPESHVADVQMATDTTATVRIEATDELSGPWRYDVYVQYGSGAWFKAAENVPIDTTASVKVYEGINHGFYAVVTDSAGNVEQKNAEREFTFEVFGSQIDTDTRIELAEGWNWMSHNQEEPLMVAELQSAGSRMLGQTEELYEDARFGWMGDLEELLPTQMYKLQMDGPLTVQLSGRLFNAGFRAVPLYEGWNWMGYPVARTMTPTEALAKLEAEEGDMLIGQDGMATYSDGQWTGTLMEMNPGQGYMFRSQSDKNLFLNATAQASSRRANSPRRSSLPDDWTVNKRKYPNVMGMIAQLWHDDALADSGEWQLGAFCGDECRGVAQTVGDGEPTQTVLMMNVYGTGSEPISFRVMNRETGEVLDAAEQEAFRADVIGSMQQPYALHIGEKTGVRYVTNDTQQTQQATYDLQGRKVEAGQTAKGIYVVTDGRKNKTQKVVKR